MRCLASDPLLFYITTVEAYFFVRSFVKFVDVAPRKGDLRVFNYMSSPEMDKYKWHVLSEPLS